MRYLSAKLGRFVKFGRSKKILVKRMCFFKLYLDSLLSVMNGGIASVMDGELHK